jgi:hypothetical protein
MIYLPLAIEIANDRMREAEREAQRRELARVAAPAPRGPGRPNPLRALVARPLSNASHAVSEAACTAATLIEGQAH